MTTIKHLFFAFLLSYQGVLAQSFLQDNTKIYAMPLLNQTPKGDVLLSWTEKDTDGKTAFCMALSKDKGHTFSEKKIIATGYGIGNSRLMRARVLSKKDGSLVAVFMNNPNAGPGRGGRGGQVAYCVSKDSGTTWTLPQPVDTDPTPNLMRGFFDATVLANDEVAVAYLKDVKGSTKHEERDLRIAITKNGVFEAEKLIDAVVCDCCNISLLVDNKGVLNVYYRDNNDNIRDIAKMASSNNGQTFSKSAILHQDNWKINGCPHSGAMSVAFGSTNLITWFSAAESEKGIRLATQEGKKLAVITEPTAKNAYVTANAEKAVFLWEQTNPATNSVKIAYQVVNSTNVQTQWMDQNNVGNATALVVGNELLIAYEQRQEGQPNTLKINKINL